jgi:hypothetical protein
MKLHATMIPYSGTVGGGLSLIDEDGRARFMVAIVGITKGISKEQTAAISSALINGIPDGIEAPEAPPKAKPEFPY